VLVAGLAISATLLFLVFRKIDGDVVRDQLAGASLGPVFLAIGLRGVMFLVVALRTRIMIAGVGRLTYPQIVKSHLLAFAVNAVVPLRAGELARVGYLARTGDAPLASCLAIVVTERLVELFTLCLVFLAVLPALVSHVPLGASFYLALAGSFAAIALGVVVSRKPELFVALATRLARLGGKRVAAWVEQRAEGFARGLANLQRASSVVAVVGLSFVFWILSAINVGLLTSAFGIELPWYGSFVLVAFIVLGLVVPSAPGAIGTYHFFLAAGLTTLGVDGTRAASFAVVCHAIAIVPYAVASIPILATDYFGRRRSA
jgi:glycosyltransferase 2 family protein